MFRVFACLTEQHDWRLVLLAGLVCFLSSLVAISLFRRAGATRAQARAGWIATAGVAAGSGIEQESGAWRKSCRGRALWRTVAHREGFGPRPSTGQHVTGDEADAWLSQPEAGEDVEPPSPEEQGAFQWRTWISTL